MLMVPGAYNQLAHLYINANEEETKLWLTKFLVLHALIAFSVADVSHLSRQYLPPAAAAQRLDQKIQPQQQVQHDEVLLDEATNGKAHVVTDVQQSLDNAADNPASDGASSEAASDPFTQPGLVGFGGFPGSSPAFSGQGFPTSTVPISVYVGQYPIYPGEGFPGQSFSGQGFPGQGFPGQGFPGQGFSGQSFPGQGFPGQGFPGQGFSGQGFSGQGFPGQAFSAPGFPGQGFPGQGFPGQGFSGQGFPGQGFPGQGFPGQGFSGQGFPGGFPGVPYQTSNQESGYDVRDQKTRLIASDTIYGENGGYVYDKPK
ncbi:RNA-binding protein 12 [Anastrepha obliqua]|uniref:RNA-binding protein 12 n=1 Tax=Anastrepha obliqua TaxID=95512 RepID=UPI002409B130|nr:RNA-binding protein 12 [Anastrepha obliqua]